MTAAAVAPQRVPSARDRVFAGGQSLNTTPNLDQPRFFVQMGWSELEVDTEAIPGKKLLRGEITPCRSHQQKGNLWEIPEGMRIPGSEQVDPASKDGRVIWAYYWKRAEHEATRLSELEKSAGLKMGLVELQSLAGLRSVYYDTYDFNEMFYPQGLNNLPTTNAELKAHLQARLEAFEGMELPADLKEFLPILTAELIAACDVADRVQSDRIDFSHRCMQLSPEDKSGYFKKGYDEKDEEMLLRTGKPRVGEALEVQAKALHLLAEDKASGRRDDPFAGLAKAMEEQNAILREQNERQNRLIEMLLAERQSKPEAEAKPTKRAA